MSWKTGLNPSKKKSNTPQNLWNCETEWTEKAEASSSRKISKENHDW